MQCLAEGAIIYNKGDSMNRKSIAYCILVLSALVAGSLTALEVDVEELENSVTDTITFINYSGPYDDIDTIDEIRGIGISLSSEIASGDSREYAGKYRITHILPSPESPLRGADLLELLPSARVDHIDNLRRIISAYLESRYGYSSEDAELLGILVTVYNAVHRGNLTRFSEAYVPELVNLLSEEKAGLSLNWSEWAGASQIVIPLASDAAPGELSSVPADELLDEAVEETLSDAEDQGLEERMDSADLIDRIVDEERTQIEEEQAAIEQEREALAEESAEIDQTIEEIEEEIASLPEDSQERQDLEQDLEEQQERQAAIEEEEEALQDRQDQTEQREEQTEAADERAREVREEVAEDIETASTQPVIQSNPVRFSRARISSGRLYSTPVIVDAVDGSVLSTGGREIIGRTLVSTRQGFVAISEEAGTPVLVLMDGDDLSFAAAGSAEVSIHSPIIVGGGDDLYAVIRDSGEWYAGRFDANLNLLFRSAIPVAEGSDLLIEDNALLVQRKDGRFTSLDLDELKVGQ